MSYKLNPPFRAEHLGSLLRPDDLLKARAQFDKKEITAEQLKDVEDKAIGDIVSMQKEVGLKSISDGEYRFVQDQLREVSPGTWDTDCWDVRIDAICSLTDFSITLKVLPVSYLLNSGGGGKQLHSFCPSNCLDIKDPPADIFKVSYMWSRILVSGPIY